MVCERVYKNELTGTIKFKWVVITLLPLNIRFNDIISSVPPS